MMQQTKAERRLNQVRTSSAILMGVLEAGLFTQVFHAPWSAIIGGNAMLLVWYIAWDVYRSIQETRRA